ncbi:predicted protein [Plenodomus lingam JN3]|uniref:Predicted protein n=1 Tax=Leptosphaeria maculans (strain JN3 / isolate v23.1.3 / race Av1-4-5-6-7-8) TaxID=985895 RepID=E4ZXW6_LEPMJ|nr:predicted protein [Plenodomus lingam JN3]CBX96211.1 predicted protein [Plenodomus lingam JN3]
MASVKRQQHAMPSQSNSKCTRMAPRAKCPRISIEWTGPSLPEPK